MSEEINSAQIIAEQRERIAELEAAVQTLERGWVDQVEQMLDQFSIFQIDAAQARVNDTLIPALAQMLAVLLIKDDGESFYNVVDWDIGTAGPMGQLRLTLQRLDGKTKAEIYEADVAALRELVQLYGQHAHTCRWWQHQDCACYLAPAYADHPGQALLTELTAARRLHDAIVYCGLDYPPIADALAVYQAARKGATDG